MGFAAGPEIGAVLAGCRITGVLGRGATSIVYRATEVRLEREVALKILSPELSDDPEFRRRFVRESKAAASLQHPNIVPVLSAGEDREWLYIVMQLVAGDSLRGVLRKRGRLDPARAISVLSQVAHALDAAHTRGLVHRDVKPSNVLIELDADGREHAYLGDFGLAKAVASGTRGTAAGQLLGTIDYMAPEQIRGEKIDGRADVYALGCVLSEALVGEPPFSRGSDVATIFAHLHDRPSLVHERVPVLPAAVDAVLERALAKDAGHRPSSCVQLMDDAAAALGIAPENRRYRWRPRRRRRVLLAAACALAAVAAALLALEVGGGGESAGAPIHHRVALPGYRLSAGERLTTGAPGAHPTVGLLAAVDTGRGPVAGALPERETGELVFRFDGRQLVHFGFMQDARNGTLLGYYVNNASVGGQLVQFPVVKTGLSTDRDGAVVVHAGIPVPPELERTLGHAFAFSIRQSNGDLVATLDLRRAVRAFAAGGGTLDYTYSGLFFLGSLRDDVGTRVPVVTNPSRPQSFAAGVSARPCSDRRCTRLGPAATDTIVVKLPEEPTVQAPRHVEYGRLAVFSGTGAPGQSIAILQEVGAGSAAPCTLTNVTRQACAPAVDSAFLGNGLVTTTVHSDGTWRLAVPLPLRPAKPFKIGPTGRYVAAEFPEPSLQGGALFGGTTTVMAEPPTGTVVELPRPSLAVRRRGSGLEVRVAVVGGDDLVDYSLRVRGRRLASGHLLSDGTVTVDLPASHRAGRVQARVWALGVKPASRSVALAPP